MSENSGEVHLLMVLQRAGAYVKRDMGLISKTKYLLLFVKTGPLDLLLLGVTWSGNVHALLEFRRKIGLISKNKYVVHFGKTRSQ